MSKSVQFFGGPLHGQVREVDDGTRRLAAVDDRWIKSDWWAHDIGALNSNFERPTYQQVSYEINLYYERRGNLVRSDWVGILEGKQNLLHHEERELERSLRDKPWQVKRLPSFLHEYDRWFNVMVYQITGDADYLWEEMRQAA